ncbi:hypothetical protein QQX98_004597 [Neonectria punicea]|uniref:Clr5 domain-containing protein n=1 Tax=Neonectria punicea TaxID=979145 RepID=A0ABR1H8Q6_9HYPO
MDHVPEELLPQSDREKYLDNSHADRWSRLKPVIVKLYTGNYGTGGKSKNLDQVVQFMKTHYSFHAASSEYPTRFRAWNVSKRTEKQVKDEITSALGRRKRPGTSTSQVVIQQGDQAKPLDTKKLKRYLKDKKLSHPVEAIVPGLYVLIPVFKKMRNPSLTHCIRLSSWDLPYKAFLSSLPKNPDEPSPFGPQDATPGYLNIHSPEALTPGREAAGPSPNMELLYQKNKEHHASLFLQGRIKDLMVRMCSEQRR